MPVKTRAKVYRCVHHVVDLAECDRKKWDVVDHGLMITPEGIPCLGTHSVLLGVVEIPENAQVDGLHRVLVERGAGSTKSYPGVPTMPDGISTRHVVGANDILDVASNPAYFGGLGITTVQDFRPEGLPIG